MSTMTEFRKNTFKSIDSITSIDSIDATPFFAVVGVTDLAVEKVREARVELEPAKVQAAVQARVETRVTEAVAAVKSLRELPAQALNTTIAFTGKVSEGYGDLAVRGQQLIERVRTQKSTQDLLAQADATVALGKGAVTSAKKAVADVERSAKATITTGRNEAVKVAETLIGSVQDEAKVARAEVTTSVKRTRTAAKRTNTTARNAAKKTATSTKAATTSARKTAAAATKATEVAATKVGD